MPRFGKLGFGESCDSEVGYSKDEQSKLDRKVREHHLNGDADGVGGASQSIRVVIGQCVLTFQVKDSLFGRIHLNVLFQHYVKHLNVTKVRLE